MEAPRPKRLCRNTKKPTFWKGGEVVEWAACREAVCQRKNETLPKDLDLPARSRSGEGRAVTFSRIDPNMPKV